MIDDVLQFVDAAGTMTVAPDGCQYSYDYESRIVEIVDSGDTTVAAFVYDALGRRIRKGCLFPGVSI